MNRRPVDAKTTRFPPGWDEARVRAVIEHYDDHQDELLAMADEELPEECAPAALPAVYRGSQRRTVPFP